MAASAEHELRVRPAADNWSCTDDSCPYQPTFINPDPVCTYDIESNLSAAGMANLIGPSWAKTGQAKIRCHPYRLGARAAEEVWCAKR
ncbi:hypothetical protein KCP78_23055 [Salmonella enterica subsp. enterica]|nr:hypothetical protein KCP78_23055 [Salmonella enterica subsp. enterica]